MERQDKRVSVALWEMEMQSALNHSMPELWSELYKQLDPKIRNYTVTYDEFVDNVTDKIAKFKDTEDRKTQVNNMLKELIDEYRN